MRRPRIRPRFSCISSDNPQQIVERVRRQIRSNNPADLKLRGTVDRLVLRFPSHSSEMWTPQIQIRLQELASGGTLIKAVVGPSTRIWKVFQGTLTALSTLGAMGLLVGFTQWSMALRPWGFYLAFAGLAGGLFLYFMAESAKERARDRAELLRSFMDSALGSSCFVPDRSPTMDEMAGKLV